MDHKDQMRFEGEGLVVLAPAKINLSLLIAAKRADGFHEIETLMAKVNWYDELFIERLASGGIEVISEGPEWAPQGRDNLIYKACDILLRSRNPGVGVKVTLSKNIPAGTGLGSASSDAAAALLGVNKLLELGAGADELKEMAAELGSDVPFFLGGPLAFCTGRGEKIEEIEKKFKFSAILIVPDISVSTKEVYENYRHDEKLYEQLKREIKGHKEKNRFDLITKMCANMLEISCFDLNLLLAELKNKVESLGVGDVCLSGSGSSMFIVVDDTRDETSFALKQKLDKAIGCKCVIVSNNRW